MNYTIIGGTGTLGRELIKRLNPSENLVTVFSRDECKQQDLARTYPKCRFIIGDIRDRESVAHAVRGAHTVFHVAAMKHIDVVERNPIQALKTNVDGTVNVAEACVAEGVKYCVFSSTDKAVEPINVYGHTKAIGEKIMLTYNSRPASTKFSVFRWGNVVGSRGSVIHLFADRARAGKPLPLTDQKMTRFWIHIEDAVSFMLERHRVADNQVQIPPMKGAHVWRIGHAVNYLINEKKPDYTITGLRPGEKIHESISPGVTSENCEQLSMPEIEEMVRRVL